MKRLLVLPMMGIAFASFAQQNPMAAQLEALQKEKDPAALQQKIQALGKGSEDDLRLLYLYYYSTKSNAQRDSIAQVSAERFPAGSFAFQKAQEAVTKETDVAKQLSMYNELRAKFPKSNVDMVAAMLADGQIQKKNLEAATPYLEYVKTINYVSILGRSMMNVDNAAADKFVKKHIDALKDTATTQSYYSLLSLYSEILVKGKKNDQALTYAEQAYTKLNRKDPELEKNYAVLLAQKGRYADAVPVLEKLVETGRANDVVRTQLRTSYKKTKVSDGDAKIAALDAKFLDNMKEEVAKKLISKTAPAFEVKDITGKTVSLADFKGKTIVIDFWATWCGPCKKSFPAMQLAVNKYKNDPNVKFLFVHTWERGTETPQKDAADYLAQNKYSFDLYMDTKDEKSQKNPAVSAFEVTGIPTKFIIDGKGNIRFNVVGFSGAGGDESAATELATMIEMVKGA